MPDYGEDNRRCYREGQNRMASDALQYIEEPQLREPALITSFAGWNDAAESATGAVRYLVRKWGARKFAEVDPEDYYDFTESRPQVRLTRGFERRIRWPANDFFYYSNPELERDYILLRGVEPQLKWRTFCTMLLDLCRRMGVNRVVLLGGLIADVPHTRPVRVTGTSSDKVFLERMESLRVHGSRYEGPTGINGVLTDRLRKEGMPCASLWATVPHYISTSNPRASQALLSRLDTLLGLNAQLSDIEREAEEFDSQVSQAVERDPDVAAYVRQLEEGESAETEPEHGEGGEHPELPAGDAVVRELEEFLRRSRGDQPGA
jgi:proteasome assembly chaperone (PAC2) family protein